MRAHLAHLHPLGVDQHAGTSGHDRGGGRHSQQQGVPHDEREIGPVAGAGGVEEGAQAAGHDPDQCHQRNQPQHQRWPGEAPDHGVRRAGERPAHCGLGGATSLASRVPSV